MPKRLSAALALLVFAICLVAGMAAGNTVSTILAHALVGMGATLLIGLVLGGMAQKMLDENVKALKQRQDNEVAAGAETVPAAGRKNPARKS